MSKTGSKQPPVPARGPVCSKWHSWEPGWRHPTEAVVEGHGQAGRATTCWQRETFTEIPQHKALEDPEGSVGNVSSPCSPLRASPLPPPLRGSPARFSHLLLPTLPAVGTGCGGPVPGRPAAPDGCHVSLRRLLLQLTLPVRLRGGRQVPAPALPVPARVVAANSGREASACRRGTLGG